MSTLAMKVVRTKRPTSGAVIGYRIVLAHLNNAAYDIGTGEYTQSFVPKYRLCESGDYREVTPEIMERYLERVSKWHKIDKIIPFN